MILRTQRFLLVGVALVGACVACSRAAAQRDEKSGTAKRQLSLEANEAPTRQRKSRQTATIHWRGVPLCEAIDRLKPLFDVAVFVDRRVDPSEHVSLDIDATSAEQVLTSVASSHDLGVARLGKLLYLGPAASAEQLRSLATLRAKDVVHLPAELRTPLMRKQRLEWPRLSEPRELVTSAIQQTRWQVDGAERIPHDLWAAGELPDLSLAEQLTVLLIGFDLTFSLRPGDRTIEIASLTSSIESPGGSSVRKRAPAKTEPAHTTRGAKQAYTLRVEEKPVGAVLKELGTRLHWAIQIDEKAIRAAGLSLDKRVSFSVEQADQEKLLDALLTPAGLEYRIDGDQVYVVPKRYGEKK